MDIKIGDLVECTCCDIDPENQIRGRVLEVKESDIRVERSESSQRFIGREFFRVLSKAPVSIKWL